MGLPGKNLRPLAGLPLIVHSIRMAAMTPEIDECVVSTDSGEISGVARSHGGNVPFIRPAELAADTTPTMPVLLHALLEVERATGKKFESVLLLQPTNPSRLPEDVTTAVALLENSPEAAGVVAVSEPAFNPRWVCVEEREGFLARSFATSSYERRQDVPPVYRINGLLYLWRRSHILAPGADPWAAPHKMLVVPEDRVIDIDTAHDLQRAELMLREGMIRVPWLTDFWERQQ